MSGLAPADEDETLDDADAAELVHSEDGGEDANGSPIEPAFDPAEFRRRRPVAAVGRDRAGTAGLSGDDVRRLQSTLSHLLELKRLLDQARG
jgi:hypothetical protein